MSAFERALKYQLVSYYRSVSFALHPAAAVARPEQLRRYAAAPTFGGIYETAPDLGLTYRDLRRGFAG